MIVKDADRGHRVVWCIDCLVGFEARDTSAASVITLVLPCCLDVDHHAATVDIGDLEAR